MAMIVEALRKIHLRHRLQEGDVSAHTKSAQVITKEWQAAVCANDVLGEVRVSRANNERIDVVDLKTKTAYELKVSGKNTHHEFYKDLVKVLTYNEYQIAENRLTKLVFISEETGIRSLMGRLDEMFLKMLESKHKLSIELVAI
ncbi:MULTISPECIES: hypothetical protein [Pseudomonadota]|uniref:hypothetical protein n=1 Tax=Pseudomonadota TaxID=1224 RepID=UPI0010615D49|nr:MULTISPECIES: hypothetical protein [Pseudomonadota]